MWPIKFGPSHKLGSVLQASAQIANSSHADRFDIRLERNERIAIYFTFMWHLGLGLFTLRIRRVSHTKNHARHDKILDLQMEDKRVNITLPLATNQLTHPPSPPLFLSLSLSADAQSVLHLLSVQANRVRRHRVLCAAQEIIANHLAARLPSFGHPTGDLGAGQVPGR